MTDEEISDALGGIAADPAEQLILRAVGELHSSSTISDQTWHALSAHLDERQLMDLVFTVGGYMTLAMAFNTFGIEPDRELQPEYERTVGTHFQKPAAGSWTEHYPGSGTEPVDYTDSIDPEFYEAEREGIFKKTWLYMGRVEKLPKVGSYFTRELPVVNTCLSSSRARTRSSGPSTTCAGTAATSSSGDDFPNEETAGSCRQFTCKYHAWRYPA